MKTLIAVLLMLFVMAGCGGTKWKEIRRGEVDKVEYLQGGWSASNKTLVYFKNGSTAWVLGHWGLPSKYVVIEYRIDWAGHRRYRITAMGKGYSDE